jgi:hypothetical protein
MSSSCAASRCSDTPELGGETKTGEAVVLALRKIRVLGMSLPGTDPGDDAGTGGGDDEVDGCRTDLPGPTTSVGTRTDYSVGPWDYPACTTRHLMAWSTRTTEEKYSVRKLYMSCTVWKTPRRTRLVLSPYSDL